MWRLKIPIAIFAALALPGCGASTVSTDRPVLAPPPVELTRACARPVDLPDGALTQGEVERHWSRDRASLAVCGRRHGALVKFYTNRDEGLTDGR